MRVMIDGNIILDVLQKREPHVTFSANVWKMCEARQIEGIVSALTFTDLVYIMRKELTPDRIQDVLKKLQLIFRFADLSVADMSEAAKMKWDDYEDAVQYATAKRVHADCIITRNIKDFSDSSVPAFTPMDFLQRML